MLSLSRPAEDTLLVQLSGSWTLRDATPSVDGVLAEVRSGPAVRRIAFDTSAMTAWDTGLLTFLTRVIHESAPAHIDVDQQGLPAGARRLLHLASSASEQKIAPHAAGPPLVVRLGEDAIASFRSTGAALAFIGEACVAFVRLLRGKARFRRSDFFLTLQECGPEALLIVTVISFLVGLILAFVGAVQLRQFGAQIYVANLVGLAMTREMGAMMTAIIMAGRTGAAFAAQLGTMQVNEEIDALTTMGFRPMEFLVLPRMLALVLMMPFLCLYADLMGILGGAVVGVTTLHLSLLEYFKQTQESLRAIDFVLGLVKSGIYGVLVAVAGCMRGMQTRGSSAAVGAATTSAVVTGIMFIITSCAVLTVVFDALGL